MRRRAKIGVLASLLVLAAGAGGASAQARALSIDRFDAEITVRPDGVLHVTETLDVRFDGSFQGVFRDLLFAHRTAEGRRARLRYRIEGATDAEGRELRVEGEGISGGRRLRIWVPGASDAVRRVVLRYRVEGGLRFFDEGPDGLDHDELYWQVTGTGWEGPIRSARARVLLPEGATGVEGWGYTGGPDSQEQAVNVRTGGGLVEIETTRELRSGEGLTISVIWEAGVVERPSGLARAAARVRDYWPLGLPVLAFVLMFRVWTLRGRDPARRALMVQYEPPDDLSPAEVGTLVDHRAEPHDITATLVDLAVRGFLTIEEKEKEGLLARLSKSRDYAFHQRRPRSAWAELRPHERAYLEGLFPHPSGKPASLFEGPGDVFGYLSDSFGAWRAARRQGRGFDAHAHLEAWTRERMREREGPEEDEADEPLQSVDLSDLQNRFYVHLDGIRKKIYGRLKEKGLYDRRPDKAVAPWMGLGMGVFAAGVVGTVLSANGTWPWLPAPFPIVIGMALSALVVIGFGTRMGVRTERGVRSLEQILGFQEFLKRVEAPQYRRMITSPEMFERYLPYAMALKAETVWAKAFDDLYREPPDWYVGSGAAGFHASSFARSMSTLSTQASQTMSSSPGGSSGSGGGGSVGGGSGGGGGGGF